VTSKHQTKLKTKNYAVHLALFLLVGYRFSVFASDVASIDDERFAKQLIRDASTIHKRLDSYVTVSIRETSSGERTRIETVKNRTNGLPYRRIEETDNFKFGQKRERVTISNESGNWLLHSGIAYKLNFRQKPPRRLSTSLLTARKLGFEDSTVSYKLERNAVFGNSECYRVTMSLSDSVLKNIFDNPDIFKQKALTYLDRIKAKHINRIPLSSFPVIRVYYIDKKSRFPLSFENISYDGVASQGFRIHKFDITPDLDATLFTIPEDHRIIEVDSFAKLRELIDRNRQGR